MSVLGGFLYLLILDLLTCDREDHLTGVFVVSYGLAREIGPAPFVWKAFCGLSFGSPFSATRLAALARV